MPTPRRESRAQLSVVEQLQEMTEHAKAEYLPVFSMDDLVNHIGKAAKEAAERGLYVTEYVFEPPSGSLDLEIVRTELMKRLVGIYTEARVYEAATVDSILDPDLYEGCGRPACHGSPNPRPTANRSFQEQKAISWAEGSKTQR